MGFSFGLQNVRDFAAIQEEQAQIQVARLQKELELHNHMIQQLETALANETNTLHGTDDSTSPNMLWLKECYIQSIKMDLKNALQKKAELERLTKEHQEELIRFSQKTKMLDTLKEKQKNAFLKQEQKKEEQLLDALTTMRFKK